MNNETASKLIWIVSTIDFQEDTQKTLGVCVSEKIGFEFARKWLKENDLPYYENLDAQDAVYCFNEKHKTLSLYVDSAPLVESDMESRASEQEEENS